MITHLQGDLTGHEIFETGAKAYHAVLREILQSGLPAGPRGMQTLELTDATVCIEDATRAVPLGARQLINPKIGATEYAQLLAGVSFLEQLDAASGSKFSRYADDGFLRGAYGPRVYSQLPVIAEILEKDPESRQAVVMISRGAADTGVKDVPCTLGLQFKIRDEKLNCTVMMRSSDAWLGVPYDWWQFSRLQMTLAWVLGIEAGTFTFFAGSLHLYERNFTSAQAVLNGSLNQVAPVKQPPAITGGEHKGTAADRMRAAQQLALQAVLHHELSSSWHGLAVPAVLGWDDWRVCLGCRYVTRKGEMCQNCLRD